MAKFKTSLLKNEIKAYDEFINVPITYDNQEFSIKLYPLFKPETITQVIKEFSEFSINATKSKITIDPLEEHDLLLYFCLRHFTDIEFIKSKSAKKIYDEFKLLLNSQIYIDIKELIPDSSIESVYDKIREMLKTSNKLENKMEQFKQDIENLPLENREMISKLFSSENKEVDVNA